MATFSQLEAAITDRLNQDGWEIKRGDVAQVMQAQEAIVHELLAKNEPVAIRGLVKLYVNYKPKAARHMGTVFGEERMIAARPASLQLKARFLKPCKDALPSSPAKISRIFAK